MFESWLKPLGVEMKAFVAELEPHQFGRNIDIYFDTVPDLTNVKIALIGEEGNAVNAIRRKLYSSAFHFKNLKIADIGTLRKSDDNFIAPLIKDLIEHGIIPVLIGNSPSLFTGQYYASKEIWPHIEMTFIDKAVRLGSYSDDSHAVGLDKILQPRNNLSGTLMGFQTFYTSQESIELLEKEEFQCLRLGKVKENVAETEPFIRDANFLVFNIDALKFSEAPGQSHPSPNGLNGDEACQVTKYAGFSDKLTSISFLGYHEEKDIHGQTSLLIAEMIWYFLDGVYNRQGDFPVSTEGLVQYLVDFKNHDLQISFWKSTRTGRWWMEVPEKSSRDNGQHRMIPCTLSDYQQACSEELPPRLWNALQKSW